MVQLGSGCLCFFSNTSVSFPCYHSVGRSGEDESQEDVLMDEAPSNISQTSTLQANREGWSQFITKWRDPFEHNNHYSKHTARQLFINS